MSVGGDLHLGFSYLVLVLVLVVLVIALVVRRKWRISVARSEEVKRLMVLASEEAARVELEAYAFVNSTSTASISPPLQYQYQYQCAVCFCPTTTRCARCKAVRYCSGKCQIVHWRQGHKEECHPFTPHQVNDVGGGSNQKVLKQDDEIHRSSFGAEGTQCTKSVQNFPEEPAPSESNHFPEVFSVNDDHEGEYLADGKGTNYSSYETERSDGHQRTNIFPAKLGTTFVNSVDQNGLPSSKKTTFVGSVDRPISGNLIQIKLNCINHNIKHGSASSSGWSASGTSESTFSEPSTPCSGFWEGTIKSSRPKIDAVDDSALSSFGGVGDGSMYNVEGTSFDMNHGPPVDVEGSDTTNVISDGSCSANLGVKKPIDMDNLSKERNENALKGKNSPLSVSEKSNHMHIYTRNNLPVLKSGEPRNTSSSAYAYPTSSAGGSSFSTCASNVSSMQSLSSERSNCVVNGMHTTLRPLESEGVSLSTGDSVAHLSSNTRRYALQGAKSGKDDGSHAVAANSSVFASSPLDARNGMKTSVLKVFDQLKAKSSQRYHLGIGSEIVGRYNNKGLFPYDLFVKLYNWNRIELRPCGLKNCGNSCYANAVLQCLACTPPLTAYFLEGLHSKACGRKKWCFTCELESLILKAKEGTSPLSPINILSQIQNIGSQLRNGSEEDAHEFLRFAIDTMQSVCLNEAVVNASRSLEEETTLVGLTFGGYLRSKIKCTKCGGKSEQRERMMDLTVEIEGNIGTLEEALRQFTDTEILDGENKYQCSRSYERAKKKLRILEAPNVLTIALKRFQSGEFGKLNKSIRFPEILDLAPYMSGTSDKSPIYRLYGVVVHLDVLNAAFSGHYVCYVKNVQNKWFEIDDSTVKAVELKSVLTKGAYMLFYARYSPRAPRLIRNSISMRDPRKPKNPIKSRSHSTGPWDAYGHTGIERLYSNNMSFRLSRPISEEDSLSNNSSSLFSEGNSHSTESSNRDSTSTDDHFDSFLGDVAGNWNSLWRNSSDSDSSSSSSSSSPSPLYSRRSSVAETDRYSSRYPETNHAGNPSFWERRPCTSSDWDKVSEPFLYSDRSKECRKLGSSSSCRETDSDRVGWANPSGIKKSGLYLRRSMRERTD